MSVQVPRGSVSGSLSRRFWTQTQFRLLRGPQRFTARRRVSWMPSIGCGATRDPWDCLKLGMSRMKFNARCRVRIRLLRWVPWQAWCCPNRDALISRRSRVCTAALLTSTCWISRMTRRSFRSVRGSLPTLARPFSCGFGRNRVHPSFSTPAASVQFFSWTRTFSWMESQTWMETWIVRPRQPRWSWMKSMPSLKRDIPKMIRSLPRARLRLLRLSRVSVDRMRQAFRRT